MKRAVWQHVGIVFLFALAACIYMFPVLEGKIIVASDTLGGTAAVQESVRYHEQTGERTWWTGSMFSGMPNYQVGGGQSFSEQISAPVLKVLRWGHRNQLFILFFYLIAFYVLLQSFGVDRWMSAAGAFAIAFSSYFLIIIAASHNGKATSITWMSMVLVGMLLIYRKKYALGGILVALFMMAGYTPHPQMAYYMALLIGLLFLAEGYEHFKQKRVRDWLIASLVFIVSLAVGFGTESTKLFANLEYAEQTMRGGHSELVKETDVVNKTKGLDIDYATQWSYGRLESITLLIPNFMGASSNYPVGNDSPIYQTLVKNGISAAQAKDFCKGGLPVYWGDQPFTSGPVYVGAIVCFLFVLALFLVRGAYMWALLAATLFSLLLSWGHHFMPLTQFFFQYFPMYSKFRAVSSILVVAEITIPLLGFMGIAALANKEVTWKKKKQALLWSTAIVGGICLVIASMGGSLFSFTSVNDAQLQTQIPDWLYQAFIDERKDMMRSDAIRSLVFVLLGAGLLYFYAQEKIKTHWAALVLGVLVLVDLWGVDKRFLNDDSFQDPKVMSNAFAMLPYEKELLQDTTHFRVLNTTTNVFNESRTSYYLKSIGGYSAVKLRRYQDLIDEHLSKMNRQVINMLNTKYFIVRTESGETIPQFNPDALGNAWYIDSLLVVNTANEESDALNTLDLRRAAVVDKQFEGIIKSFVPQKDSLARVELTKYTPSYIEYETDATEDGTVVFSEIYYPYGWKAYLDGSPVEHYRVNYTLRALPVPAGKHHIRFEFSPDSIAKGNSLALLSLGILFFTILAYLGHQGYTIRKKASQ